jgi:hypothetical protein
MIEDGVWKYNEWKQQGRLVYLRIGIDPTGGNSPLGFNVKWSNRFYSHVRYNTFGINTVAQADHVTVFIELRGIGGYHTFWHMYAVDDCRLTAVNNFEPYELKDLKGKPNGTGAEVSDLVITATPIEAGAYYAQVLDRSQGIRIESSQSVDAGTRVNVKGTLQSLPTGERYLGDVVFSNAVGAADPAPLMMLSSSVGGSAFGTQPAVAGSKGPHNTALVVKVAGTVTARADDSSYIFISDGSLGGDGIKVDTSHVPASIVPNAGDVVAISGISSIYSDGGTIKPLIIARYYGDISSDLNP